MVELNVDALTTGYADKEVLKDVSFRLVEGDFVGVVGPNGSGKSTLIRALTGVIPALEGEIFYDGIKIGDLNRKDIARKVSVVPQDTFINFPFTVWDVVLMGRTPYLGRFENPGKKDNNIAEKALKATRTLEFKDRSVRELSGGELQRVVVARALAQEPDLIMLDEATSHLDIGRKLEVMDLMKKMSERGGVGVLSIHHDLNLAARYCESIILLDEGRVHAYGRPEEVLTRAHLRAVYGIEAEVHENPRDGSLYVTPVETKRGEPEKGVNVHVVCGGGSAGDLLKDLVEEGYEITVGVLNVMDSDLEIASFLDLNSVTEAPFSSISREAYELNIEHIKEADIIIGTSFAVGEGNILNLKALMKAAGMEKEIVLIEESPIEDRNYAGEKVIDMYRKIKSKSNVQVVGSKREVFKEINKGNT